MYSIQVVTADMVRADGSVDTPEGMRVTSLGYKTVTDKVTGVKSKKDTKFFLVPNFSDVISASVLVSGSVDKMMIDLVNGAQDDALREWDATGELESGRAVENINALCDWYFTDGRKGGGTGVKQEQLIAWIDGTIGPILGARIARSMSGVTERQRQNLVTAVIEQFKIAASRGNRVGNKTGTEAMFKDLVNRLLVMVEQNGLDVESMEFAALMKRIEKHRDALRNPVGEVIAEF